MNSLKVIMWTAAQQPFGTSNWGHLWWCTCFPHYITRFWNGCFIACFHGERKVKTCVRPLSDISFSVFFSSIEHHLKFVQLTVSLQKMFFNHFAIRVIVRCLLRSHCKSSMLPPSLGSTPCVSVPKEMLLPGWLLKYHPYCGVSMTVWQCRLLLSFLPRPQWCSCVLSSLYISPHPPGEKADTFKTPRQTALIVSKLGLSLTI